MGYGKQQITLELSKTANNMGYYGNSLLAARTAPVLTDEDRMVIDRWLAGSQVATDCWRLQEIAIRLSADWEID